MPYEAEEIAERLRAARERGGLSQRELSARTGIPQGQISRIEQGAVDFRLSTLLALSRALDLEPMLVPRALIPAVSSLARQSAGSGLPFDKAKAENLLGSIVKTLRSLPPEQYARRDMRSLENILDYMSRISLDDLSKKDARLLIKILEQLNTAEPGSHSFGRGARELRELRNWLAHVSDSHGARARPAYSLDAEDENG